MSAAEQLMLFADHEESPPRVPDGPQYEPHVCLFPGGCWRCADRGENELARQSDSEGP